MERRSGVRDIKEKKKRIEMKKEGRKGEREMRVEKLSKIIQGE